MSDMSLRGAGVVERFINKVNIPSDPDDCWEWTAGKNGRYGMMRNEDQQMTMAHRVSWEIFNNKNLPKGHSWHVDHLCANTTCVNPLHLELVPNGVNTHRGSAPHFKEAA